MDILAISGSLKAASSNTSILNAIAKLAPGVCDINFFKDLAAIPAFNPDLDTDNPPTAVSDFRSALNKSAGVIFCTPEYAFNMPGSLKNALDWTVSSGEFIDKPVAVISASPMYLGGDKANAALVTTLKTLSAKFPEKGVLIIPGVSKKLNEKGTVIDNELEHDLKDLLGSLMECIEQNQPMN